MRTRHLALLLAAAALTAPAPAGARWDEPQDLAPLPPGFSFAYDGNARGDRIAVWEAGGGTFMYAQARPGEPLGPPRPLPDDRRFSDFGPHVELDESGNALLVWSYFDQTEEPELRGDGDGCCNGLRARVIRRDGSFSATTELAPVGEEARFADMQAGPGGAVGVAFHLAGSGASARLQARFGTVRAGLGVREHVARTPFAAPVALSFVRRRARVTYASSTGFGDDTEPVVFRELERRRRGSYRRLPSPGRSTLARDTIRFATAPGGEQVVTWMRQSPRDPFLAQAVYSGVRRPGRPFSFRKLASESAFGAAPVAIEPGGNALAAWDSARQAAIVTALRRPARQFGTLTRMNSYDEPIDLGMPAIDVNGRGHGLLAWTETPLGGAARLVGAFRNARGSALEHHVIEPAGSPFAFYALSTSLDREGRGHVAYATGGRLKVIAARIGG